MRAMAFRMVITIFVLFLTNIAASAHHSFAAQYDRQKPVTLKGTVTKVEWMNPHIYFYIDVKSADGTVANWAIEVEIPAVFTVEGGERIH